MDSIRQEDLDTAQPPTPQAPTGADAAPADGSDSFASLGVVAPIAAALAELGYEEPTPIQRASIPRLLEGRDLLGQAATGTGKTAAFALPMVQRCVAGEPVPNRPRGFVLVPTRELAMQVAEAVQRYGKPLGIHVVAIFGGQSFRQQLRALERGVEVVVATPGRALDHIERGTLQLDELRVLVLDEADEMLDMGFAEDLEKILSRAPRERQTALFSATLAPRILKIAQAHLRDPVRIEIAREAATPGEMPRVRQIGYLVKREHKATALGRVLDMQMPTSAIVFCRTRLEVDQLQDALNARGYRAEALHGGFAQEQRDRVMGRFRAGKSDLLIATDVAARGLDIEHVTHVINYDVPTEPEAYVHRIGRTGRAGREGVAITFVEPRERRLVRNIEVATGQRIEPQTIPTVDDLRTRRLEATRERLTAALTGGELEEYRQLVAEMATTADPLDLAAAAVKLAHEAGPNAREGRGDEAAPQSESEVVLAPMPPRRAERPFTPRGDDRHPQGERAFRDERPRHFHPREERGPREDFRGRGEIVRLFVGAGRMEDLRPGDLVGAITNEAGIPNSRIGKVRIEDRFSLVEVAPEDADRVIQALRRTKLRGRRVLVRFDRGE